HRLSPPPPPAPKPALMSGKSTGVEWVETTEEVVMTEEYCEECLTLFQVPSDPANMAVGPSFILDFPASTGLPQRALLTLPYGLVVGRSSVPNAGVGVINHGPTVSPGMHFGPYEGDVTTREDAMASNFSWEIYKEKDEYEYIDAARESHSNWMRYVNCARNKDETNLLAVQYKGSILFHCCRDIHPGDELMVWPSAKFLAHNTTATSHLFPCPHCELTFTTESFLQRHTQDFHPQPEGGSAAEASDAGSALPADTSLVVVSVDPVESKTCGDCGKTFNENAQEAMDVAETGGEAETSPFSCPDCDRSFANEAALRRHKATVHEGLRPYVCTVCQKCFGQYTDLTRHLRRHHQTQSKRGKKVKEAAEGPATAPFSCAECSLAFASADTLQQHVTERHAEEEAPVEHREDDRSRDPDYSPQTSLAETVEFVQKRQRPQRLGAGSKIAAITKLIAPKRRAPVACKKPLTGPGEAPPSAVAAANGKLPKNKRLGCNRCKRTYGNPDDLKAHTCSPKQLKCGQCGATFSKSGFLKRHEQVVHENATSYSCNRCGKVFSTSGNLKQHQKSNTCMKYHCTSELFPCSFCQFSFTMKSYLIKHVKRHHPVEYLSHFDSNSLEVKEGKPYVCPHCGKSCASSKVFKSHACFQQVKVLYLCNDCGKGFINHYGLKQHQRVHTGEKPYTCPHCGKSFSYMGQLNVHLRTHTGEKPYLCTHCGESFRQSGDLKRHERKHTGVRPHSCPECCKSFSRPQSLKAHQLLHMGQRMFKCTQCGKSFSRNYHLRRHHQKMHL
uniref:Uncharacterized protein n=1 Tax=Cyclopterus lumpus TaxID=8103 RepID=A0A8C2XC88_CYCLU